MPERHSSGVNDGKMIERVRGGQPVQGRAVGTGTAEAMRRWRAGIRSPGGKGVQDLVWSQPRNGLPWKPYVYRGLGYDVYASSEELRGDY